MLPKIKNLLFEVEFYHSDSPYQSKSSDIYLNKFHQLRQTIITNLQEFIPVDVVIKQPPPHYTAVTGNYQKKLYVDMKKNKVVEFPRKNSFQIYVDNFLLFSRLESNAWPDINGICEWALRVAEKIVDAEIDKEEGPLKKLINTKNVKQADDQAALKTEKLPPVSRGQERVTISQQKAMLPNNVRGRYTSLREDNNELPNGTDRMNYTITQKNPLRSSANTRNKMRSIDVDKSKSRDERSYSREQNFHWHLDKKSTVGKQFQSKRNEVMINTFELPQIPNRVQHLELSPLPAVNERATQQKKDEDVKEEQLKKIQMRIGQNQLNIYKDHYKIEGNVLTKISFDQVWSPLLCQNPLPLSSQYYIHLIVHSSKNNLIQIGIAPLTFYPHSFRSEKPDCMISFNCGNGFIKDSKHNQFSNETSWREGGKKVSQASPFHFLALINMHTRIIEWHINKKIVASSKITSQFNNGFRAFVSLYNCKDIVFLNQNVHRPKQQPKNIVNITVPITQNRQESTQNDSKCKKADGFAQTNINEEQNTTTMPIIQNRIYPQGKKQMVSQRVDEITQTTMFFQGKIKKQRFYRFLEKSGVQKNQDKQKQFNQKDVEIINQIIQKKEQEKAADSQIQHIIGKTYDKEKTNEIQLNKLTNIVQIPKNGINIKSQKKELEQPSITIQVKGSSNQKQIQSLNKPIKEAERVNQYLLNLPPSQQDNNLNQKRPTISSSPQPTHQIIINSAPLASNNIGSGKQKMHWQARFIQGNFQLNKQQGII